MNDEEQDQADRKLREQLDREMMYNEREGREWRNLCSTLLYRLEGYKATARSLHNERMYLYDRLAQLDPEYAASADSAARVAAVVEQELTDDQRTAEGRLAKLLELLSTEEGREKLGVG